MWGLIHVEESSEGDVGGNVAARGDARAMVRNLYFNAREEDLERLQKFYEEQLFPLICELDEAAQEQEDVLPVRLSILWAPDDLEEEEVQDDEDDS